MNMHEHNHDVCPLKKANHLYSFLRKAIHNPKKLLNQYVKEGMTVIDIGCGPGLFSIEMAKLVGKNGKVIAVDLQHGMLDLLLNKIKGTELEKRITLFNCKKESIGVKEKVDFALAFYLVHEVPDQNKFFAEIYDRLNPGSVLMVIEPKKRVSKEEFNQNIVIAKSIGFKVVKKLNILFSYSILLEK
jgi:ubiquinone/menaquinone biosynthesis C-methylase UbiE